MTLNAKQLGIIGGATTVVIILFMMPKGVVKKEENAQDRTTTQVVDSSKKEASLPDVESSHQAVGSETLSAIRTLKSRAAEAKAESKIKAINAVADKYREANLYDSAAIYLEEQAEKSSNTDLLTKAADAYYDAFSLAIKEDKRARLLVKTQELYERLVKANPSDLDLKAKSAMTYVEGPNPMQGIGILRDVLKENPNHELAIYQLGQLSIRSNQYEKALPRFEKLVSLFPKDAKYQYYLGISLKNLGKKEDARKALLTAKKLNTDPTAAPTIDDAIAELNK